VLVSFGVGLSLVGIYYLGPRGGRTNFIAGLPYAILGVPPGASSVHGWLGESPASSGSGLTPRIGSNSIRLLTIVPLLLWFARLVATLGQPNDPIAVSTVFALFVISRDATIAARLLRSCFIAARTQLVVAEDVCVADDRVCYINGIPLAPELR
jgi:hypothetical protein